MIEVVFHFSLFFFIHYSSSASSLFFCASLSPREGWPCERGEHEGRGTRSFRRVSSLIMSCAHFFFSFCLVRAVFLFLFSEEECRWLC